MSGYVGAVRKLIAHLLLMLSVLAMPFAMQSAAAAPAPHHAADTMPMGDCPDGQGQSSTDGGIAECTMICASALPAAASAPTCPLLILREPARTAGARALRDIEPEIATPPPKAS